MKIESYKFGTIVIGGREYHKDLIVGVTGVQENWWRQAGHKLAVEDIRHVVEEQKPDVLIVGQGKFGMMKILPETGEYLNNQGIQLISESTSRAVEIFNRMAEKEKVIAALHLTC
ncbi:MAG: hypothetical protein GXO75_10935 [Calditrichaeota bacterium]|nr:hypothetical protein [Calditrichota bacterium]